MACVEIASYVRNNDSELGLGWEVDDPCTLILFLINANIINILNPFKMDTNLFEMNKSKL